MPFPPSQQGPGQAAPATAPAKPPAPAAPQGPPWHPPLPVWLFLLLHVLSLTLYTIFWIGRVAGDIRRHLDPEARVWRYVLGYMIVFVQPFVVVKVARHFAVLNARQGRTLGPPTWVMVTLAMINIPLQFAVAQLEYENQAIRGFLILVFAMAVVALPWLLLQRQLNVFKAGLTDVAWTAPPHRLTVPQYFVLSFGLLFWGFVAFGLMVERPEFESEPAGIALETAEEVRGDSGLYALSSPGPGWRRLPTGSIMADSDLDLAGPGFGTELVVYVHSSEDESVDDFVDYRRRTLRDDNDSLQFQEFRSLLGGSAVPVSFARYDVRGRVFGDPETYWVATVRLESTVIEVIGWAESDGPGPDALEGLVKSLTLVEPSSAEGSDEGRSSPGDASAQ